LTLNLRFARPLKGPLSHIPPLPLQAHTRDVPVYVLQLERDTAILLDEHYNARALDDMILVVANSARRCAALQGGGSQAQGPNRENSPS
jgi:hypothetical protein